MKYSKDQGEYRDLAPSYARILAASLISSMVGAAIWSSCVYGNGIAGDGASAGRESSPTSPDSAPGAATLAAQVQDALHADPYFYDQHVTVSVDRGRVVLHGFVFSDWDLRSAMRIARGAAPGHTVVNELTIKEAGRR